MEMHENKNSPSERTSTHKKGQSKATTKAREGQTSAAPITLLHFSRNYALALFEINAVQKAENTIVENYPRK